MAKSLINTNEMLRLRAAGATLEEIGEKAGISAVAVMKRIGKADRIPRDAESLKAEIIKSLDPSEMSVAQKATVLKTLTKSRKRTARRDDLSVQCRRFLDDVVGHSFTPGAPPITEDQAKRFFMSLTDGTYKPPDMSPYRIQCWSCLRDEGGMDWLCSYCREKDYWFYRLPEVPS
jgi:hypothetical protein